MTQYEMTENLSVKCDVTLEEAKAALEASDWNTLSATHLLEQEKFRRMQLLNEIASSGEAVAVQAAPEEVAPEETAPEETAAPADKVEAAEHVAAKKHRGGKALRRLGGHFRRLVACGNRNRLVVHKGSETLLELPVTALAVLMLCAFWVCVPLLVIGLFAGFHYSFSGQDLNRESINRALDKASDAAMRVKEGVA